MNSIKNIFVKLSIGLLIVFILSGIKVSAQQKMMLTIDKAVQIGLENSKILHSASMKTQFAEAKTKEIVATRLPSLKFAAGYTRLSDVPPFEVTIPLSPISSKTVTLSPVILDSYNLRLTLLQPVFTGFRLQNSANSAKYNTLATKEDYNKDRIELIANIKTTYWNLFKAIEYQKIVDENIDQVKAHLTDIQNLFKQGMMTNSDVLKVQTQLSNTQLLQINARNIVQIAATVLNNLLGLPLETELQLESKINHETKELPDQKSLIQVALNNRSEIKSIQHRIKSTELGVAIANSVLFPQMFLTSNYYYSRPNQRIMPAKDEFKDTWDIGITATLELWNWGATIQQVKQAQSQLAQIQDTLAQVKDGIILEVTQNYLNLIQTKEAIKVAKQVVQQSEENYRITREKFKSGLALNSDLIDAEVMLLQTKINYTQSFVDYELAQIKLQKSIGE